jgi:hypothetical protein
MQQTVYAQGTEVYSESPQTGYCTISCLSQIAKEEEKDNLKL